MKAISVQKFGGPEVLTAAENIAIPSFNDDEILIKIHAAGVNPVDTYIRTGTFPDPPTLPYTPGMDGAGVVEKVGKNVKKFKAGDRVYVTCSTRAGTYAEYTVANPLHVGHLGKMSFEEGAGIGIPYYTAYKSLCCLVRGKAGETVFVHGASGAVGIASVQLAKSIGLKVIGTAGSADGMKLVKDNGADLVFNHREEGYMKKVAAAAPEGIDIIMEMLANVNLPSDLDLIKLRGRIVIVGCRSEVKIDPIKIMFKECVVTGVILLHTTEAEWHEMHGALQAGIATGWLKPHIGMKFALKDAPKAHDIIINTTAAMGRIIFNL